MVPPARAGGGVDHDQPTNDPPVAVDDSAEVDENEAVSIDVLSNDIDSRATCSLWASSSHRRNTAVLTIDGDSITYTPNPTGTGSIVHVHGQ